MTVAPLPSSSPDAARATVVRPLDLPRRRSWQPADPAQDRPRYTQAALALSYPIRPGVPATPRPPALSIVRDGSAVDCPVASHTWAATFVQAVLEVIASDRPISQLVRWTSRSVYGEIAQRRDVVARHRGAAGPTWCRQRVATVRVCQPGAGWLEVSARITLGRRSRALAARLDYLKGRWVCTAICFG